MKSILKKKFRGARYRFLRLFRPKRRLIKQVEYMGNVYLVLANEDIGWRLITNKEYEREEIIFLEKLIREDDVCLDVGGNIGIYSVIMAKKASHGKVITFEPVPLNRNILAVNVILNGLNNVEIRENILNDTIGIVEFSVCEDTAYSSIRDTKRKVESFVLKVHSTTLDELFGRENKKVDIIKIDVEGAELLVLKGGNKLLSNPKLRPRALLIELSPINETIYNYHPDDVIRYMNSHGYEVYSIENSRIRKGWPSTGPPPDALFIHREHNF
ncbi:MAG: FkbM family methyltransferase [Candidatus Hodarchaeota archaeon]